MTSWTTSLRLEKQVTGSNSNTWGDRLDLGVIDLVDAAVAGARSLVLAGNYSLTTANGGDDDARNAMLLFTGSAGAVNVTMPTAAKMYLVRNNNSGAVTMKMAAGGTVAVPAAGTRWVYSDGTDVKDALADYLLSSTAATTYQPLNTALSAYAGLGTTGIDVRTAAGTVASRSLAAPAAGFTITNSDGVSGNPTFVLANDLAQVEALATNGIVTRTGSETWTTRTITGTANEITATNGDGVAGAPTLSLPTALTFTGKTVTGGTFSGVTVSGTTTNSGTISGGTVNPATLQQGSVTVGTAAFLTAGTSANNVVQLDGSAKLPAVDGSALTNVNSVLTGTIVDYVGTTAPTGYVLASGKTLGDASSGGTERANADTSALFTLLWNGWADAQAAVSTGRGASAAADFAAHKTITLPDLRGRIVAGLDNLGGTDATRLGSTATGGITSANAKVIGSTGGETNHTMLTAEMPSHTHNVTMATPASVGGTAVTASNAADGIPSTATAAALATGSGTAHNIAQPLMVMSKIIKL